MTSQSQAPGIRSRRWDRIVGSPIDASIGLLQRQTRDVISFAMGCPAKDNLAASFLGSIAGQLIAEDPDVMNYGPTEGERSLRTALTTFLKAHLDEAVTPDQLLVTSGGMQGLDLVAKLFINPGDAVLVEEPLYANTASVFRGYEAQLIPVPVDEDGMMVDEIERLVAKHGTLPKLINVIPNFQNPTGYTLSLDRRRRLIDLARTLGAIVLEDDPYGLLGFDGRRLPSLRELSGYDDLVVSVQTFSKILVPGLRVGWVVADKAIIAKMVDAKQAMDTCSNVLGQRIIARFLDQSFATHIEGLRSGYAERRDAMIAALRTEFGNRSGFQWNEPDGGFFLWLTLPEALDSGNMFATALESGVAYVPGNAFSNVDGCRNMLRLCFAYPSPDDIRTGVKRLAETVERELNAR